mmetsp:Transcript_44065/g.133480  ORF Transcript_44065/g.133480 Transcript_44065/m.133480 type:complete len:205 (-) Transcript_44065:218-832(-)
MPAHQTKVPYVMPYSLLSSLRNTWSLVTLVTKVLRCTETPCLVARCFNVWSWRSWSKVFSRSYVSMCTSTNFVRSLYILTPSDAKKSVNSPQSSTPVGPPPTTINVKISRILASSSELNVMSESRACQYEASSNLRRMWSLNTVASAVSFMNSACSLTPGMLKSFGWKPTPTTSLSYGMVYTWPVCASQTTLFSSLSILVTRLS